jgi:hypothetical protein
MVVAVVVEMLVVGVMEMVIADCFDWRSETFLGSFSVYGGILEDFFNLKYRPTIFSVQSENFNNSDVSASIFMIAEP